MTLALGPSAVDVEAIYDEYGKRCYSLALRIVRDRNLAQDVVQDVFESLHRHPTRFDGKRGSLPTWLMTLTHHKAVDLVRTQQRRGGLDVTVDACAVVLDSSPTPEVAACSADARSRVHAALRQLRPSEREVIVLAYFGGHSQSSIALHLNIPLGTVKSRTVAGMRRLHKDLAALAG